MSWENHLLNIYPDEFLKRYRNFVNQNYFYHFNLKEYLLSRKIMYCKKQENNEINFISEYDIEKSDLYLKRIEEK